MLKLRENGGARCAGWASAARPEFVASPGRKHKRAECLEIMSGLFVRGFRGGAESWVTYKSAD